MYPITIVPPVSSFSFILCLKYTFKLHYLKINIKPKFVANDTQYPELLF